jgi:glucokinase
MITGAVDIGGTKIAVGAIDDEGRVLAKEETPTAAEQGFESAIGRVAAMLERVCLAVRVVPCGIGIGCTGPINPVTGEVGAVDFLPGWKGCNPVERLAQVFNLSVAMENDADAVALGEAEWGAGRGRKSLICVTVGTGIGGGIILNGQLYRGVDGSHPEIGHHVIDDSGPLCSCGAKGCWEALASGPAIAERFSREHSFEHLHRNKLTAKQVCELARAGDATAALEVKKEGYYLGIGIANLISLYAPEVIVLAGNVMDSADLFLPEIHRIIRSNCRQVPAERVELKMAFLGSDAPLIGAGMVWRHRYRPHGDS